MLVVREKEVMYLKEVNCRPEVILSGMGALNIIYFKTDILFFNLLNYLFTMT